MVDRAGIPRPVLFLGLFSSFGAWYFAVPTSICRMLAGQRRFHIPVVCRVRFDARIPMKIWLAALLTCMATTAGAEMWKCIGADGNPSYTNVRTEAKGCKSLNLEPLNTAPAQRAPQQKPANFPSVDSDTQKQRDAGRRKILDQELAQEQQLLDVAKKQLSEQQEIRLGSEKNFARVEERLKPFESRVKLHESNIESLKRELANIK
jgi:hypothetical protein